MEFAGWKLRTDAPEAEASEEVVEETVEATETEIVEDGGMVFNPGDSIVVTADTTFVAQWKEIPTAIVITFYANGGEGEMEAATPDEDGHYTLPENGFTAPEDKEFIGWQVGEEAWQVGDEITVEEDVTILALWQYEGVVTITFDANGGEGEMEAALTDREGNLTLPENEFTAPEGIEFAGWQVGEEVKQAGETITVTEAVTAVAQWQEAEAETEAEAEAETEEAAPIAVSFDGNGAEGEMEPIAPDEEGNCELPESAFTAPEGTTFAGWQIGEEVKQAGETIAVTEAVTAVAQWQEAKEEDEETEETEAKPEGEENAEAQPEGEAAEATETTEATEATETTQTRSVFFDENGGSGNMKQVTVEDQGVYTLPENGYTAPEGMTFAGWLIGEVIHQPGDQVTISEDTLVMAQWQSNEPEAPVESAEEPTEQAEAPAEGTEEPVEGTEEQQTEEPVVEETEEQQTEEPVVEETEEQQTEEPIVEETEEQQTEEPVVEETEEQQTEEPEVDVTEGEPELEFGTEEAEGEPEAEDTFSEDEFVEEEVPVEEPVTEETVVEEPVTEESVIEEPVVEEPAAEEIPAEEPASETEEATEPEAEQPVESMEIYTVSFDGGGADGEMEPVQVTGGSEYVMPNPGYTIEGASFDCWEITGNGESESFAINAGEPLIVGGDMTATAVWAFSEEGEVLEAGTEAAEETADADAEGGEFEADETEAVAAEDTEAIVEGEGETEENAEPEVVDAPSATGTAVSGTGIAAIVTAVVLLVAAAAFAILKKKKKH